ncbi:MAG TPA: hypothetical protein VFM68_03000 [Candidatus Saccharimonadales bacterium]|nr:hypothetical protein [Candidatus Saccharimonadales bacterium]
MSDQEARKKVNQMLRDVNPPAFILSTPGLRDSLAKLARIDNAAASNVASRISIYASTRLYVNDTPDGFLLPVRRAMRQFSGSDLEQIIAYIESEEWFRHEKRKNFFRKTVTVKHYFRLVWDATEHTFRVQFIDKYDKYKTGTHR